MIPSSCASCGGSLSTRYAEVEDPQSRERFSVLACEACGLGHTSPVPDNPSRYYGPDYYGGRHGLTHALCLWRRTRLLDRFGGGDGTGQRRLLDVGCGDGSFLEAARKRGWEVAGTEIEPHPHSADLNIRSSIAETGGGYTCATLWHSLEHVRDPRATLSEVASALVPGGTVLIAVPDAQSVQARLYGPVWRHLDVPRHLFHFGAQSLELVLSKTGFVPFWRWNQELEYDLFGWTQSLLHAVSADRDLLLRSFSGREKDPSKRLAGLAVGGALAGIFLPVAMATAASGSGGTLVVAARLGARSEGTR